MNVFRVASMVSRPVNRVNSHALPFLSSFHGFIAWMGHVSKLRGRKRGKCTNTQCASNHAESFQRG